MAVIFFCKIKEILALVYEKRVGIYGKHEQGTIRIKPYYWEDGVEISWKQAMD